MKYFSYYQAGSASFSGNICVKLTTSSMAVETVQMAKLTEVEERREASKTNISRVLEEQSHGVYL